MSIEKAARSFSQGGFWHPRAYRYLGAMALPRAQDCDRKEQGTSPDDAERAESATWTTERLGSRMKTVLAFAAFSSIERRRRAARRRSGNGIRLT